MRLENVEIGKPYRMKNCCENSYHYFAPGSTVKVVEKRNDRSCICLGIDKRDGSILTQRISLLDLEEIQEESEGTNH